MFLVLFGLVLVPHFLINCFCLFNSCLMNRFDRIIMKWNITAFLSQQFIDCNALKTQKVMLCHVVKYTIRCTVLKRCQCYKVLTDINLLCNYWCSNCSERACAFTASSAPAQQNIAMLQPPLVFTIVWGRFGYENL